MYYKYINLLKKKILIHIILILIGKCVTFLKKKKIFLMLDTYQFYKFHSDKIHNS